MRRLAGLALLALIPSIGFGAAEYYRIDPAHTFPHFAIKHGNFSTLYGRFDQTSGRLIVDWENKNGSVDIKIAAVSISTGHKKRDDHLRSPDFLNVTEFPDIQYRSTNIEFTSDTAATVDGNLTIMGVTKPTQLKVNRYFCGDNPINKKKTCGFEAIGEIKRSDFGNTFGSPGIGDKMNLWFEVEAIKENF
ncbi:MAG: YceI family protein [Gammaproteobacteria bacterium]|nr:YceI family protein [Gammaproteobacteria bacterium]MDH5693846.1 YceI family protein [Gammaproteobacteria bacterium]